MKKMRLGHFGINAPEGKWHFPKQNHDFCEMVVVTSGSETIETGNGRFTAIPGDVVLFKPNFIHEEWSVGNEKLRTIVLGFEMNPDKKWPLIVSDRRGRIRLLAEWMIQERDSGRIESLNAIDPFFGSLLAEYSRLTANIENEMVEKVRRNIRNNITADIDLDMMARWAGLSKYHFIRKYSELTGRTPFRDVQAIRASYAKDLILTTNMSLKEIAGKIGLSDIVTLSKVFRRNFNTSPGKIRIRMK